MNKICKNCNICKDIIEYHKHKGICKVCYREKSKHYREINKDITRERQKNGKQKIKKKEKSLKENN